MISFATNIAPEISVAGSTPIINVKDEVEDLVLIDATNYSAAWSKFKNLIFNEPVNISNANLGIGIGFENCTFQKKVVFINNSAAGFDNSFYGESYSVFFKGCVFEDEVEFAAINSKLERDLRFEACKINRGIVIRGIGVTAQGITFDDCDIDVKFDVENSRVKSGISITNCRARSSVRLITTISQSISFLRGEYKSNILLWGCNVGHSIAFNDGEFQGGITLKETLGTPSLTIAGGKYRENFSVNYSDKATLWGQGVKKYYLTSCEFTNGFYVNGVQSITTDKPLVDLISLNVSAKMQGDISMSSLHVGEIALSGINSKATIKFNDIYVNKFLLEYFYNHAQLVLIGIKASYVDWFKEIKNNEGETINEKIDSSIRFLHSNLGKAQFFTLNFKSFAKVHIYNTNLTEIIFSNVKWFDAKKIGLIDLDEWIKGAKKLKKKITEQDTVAIDLMSRKEIFRQLKFASDKQGDRVQALEFQRWEMYYYGKFLSITESKKKQDRFILWSSLTNNFGQSWFKAVWIGLIFTFILYIPIALLGSDKISPFALATSWREVKLTLGEIFIDQIRIYPQLLNPTHILNRMYTNVYKLPALIHWFDGLHRIITTYFIFQIISAFRKYVK